MYSTPRSPGSGRVGSQWRPHEPLGLEKLRDSYGVWFYLPSLFPFGPGGVPEDREWVGIAHETIALLGLVGFAWRLRIGWRWVWKVFVAVEVCGLLVLTPFELYFALPALPAEPWLRWSLLGMFGFSLAFSVIRVYALFRYAFHDDSLWTAHEAPGGKPITA